MSRQKLQHFARLRELPVNHSTIVALVLCQRMLINAKLYFQACELKTEAQKLDAMLEQLWNKALKKRSPLNSENFQLKLEDLLRLTKDDSLAGASSRDLLVSLGICLDALDNTELNPAVQVAKISQGDIERFIETTENIELSAEAFRAHELTQFELSVLDALLDFFTQQSPNLDDIKALRDEIKRANTSNLGLSLETQ